VGILTLLASGCAGASVSTRIPTGPSDEGPPVVTLSASGARPTILHIYSREQATFVNGDSRPHEVVNDRARSGDPGCDGVGVGVLQPAESRKAAVLPNGIVCYYRDAADPGNVQFQGFVLMHY
jgi:hypothetical protein